MRAWRETTGGVLMGLTLAGLDELDKFPSEAARREALESYARQIEGFTNPRWWLGIALVGGGTFFAFSLTSHVLLTLLPGLFSRTIIDAILGVVFLAVFFLLLRWFHRAGAARALRIELLKAGVPVCPKCGQLLTGLPADVERCPECGGEFDELVLDVLRHPPADGVE